jgi:hypothetical protein
MTTEEINMNVGDLVVAVDVNFEGDPGLTAGTPGLIKRVEHGSTFFNPQVLVYWTRYNYQTWEHPDAVEVVSATKK